MPCCHIPLSLHTMETFPVGCVRNHSCCSREKQQSTTLPTAAGGQEGRQGRTAPVWVGSQGHEWK